MSQSPESISKENVAKEFILTTDAEKSTSSFLLYLKRTAQLFRFSVDSEEMIGEVAKKVAQQIFPWDCY